MSIKTLTDLRHRKGMTCEEVGNELGFTRGMVSFLEKGRVSSTVSVVYKLAKLYDVSPRLIATMLDNSDSRYEKRRSAGNKYRANPDGDTNLSRILREKGISIRRLSAMTGISELTLSRYCHGREPKASLSLIIADALDVSYDDLWNEWRNKNDKD